MDIASILTPILQAFGQTSQNTAQTYQPYVDPSVLYAQQQYAAQMQYGIPQQQYAAQLALTQSQYAAQQYGIPQQYGMGSFYNNGINSLWNGFPQQGYNPYATANMGNFYNNYIDPQSNSYAAYYTPYSNLGTSMQAYSVAGAPSEGDVRTALNKFTEMFQRSPDVRRGDYVYGSYQAYWSLEDQKYRNALNGAAAYYETAMAQGMNAPPNYYDAWKIVSYVKQITPGITGQTPAATTDLANWFNTPNNTGLYNNPWNTTALQNLQTSRAAALTAYNTAYAAWASSQTSANLQALQTAQLALTGIDAQIASFGGTAPYYRQPASTAWQQPWTPYYQPTIYSTWNAAQQVSRI